MSIATDHALATIANILGRPDSAHGQDRPVHHPVAGAKSTEPDKLDSAAVREADGYCRTGPGPMAALRFKWTVRRGDDGYYVDETIGTGSMPLASGPMSGEAAIAFVDARTIEAQERFAALKSEMTGQGPPAPILMTGVGEK
jgi:hypothetical protein